MVSFGFSKKKPFGTCGGQKMAPHVNKWSPLDGAHE